MNIYRQGDVLVVATDTIPPQVSKASREQGRIVLAHGEVTGHAHAILDRDADLYHAPDLEDRFLRVLADGGVDLVHEEHDTVHLPAGDYRVTIQREYQPGELPRRVAD